MLATLKNRLTLTYTIILSLALVIFGVAVYFISLSTLTDDIDRGLSETASQLRGQTEAYALGERVILAVPEGKLDAFQSATYFYVLVNDRGKIIASSESLAGYDQVLDPAGPRDEPFFSTTNHEGRELRVLTEPLFVEVRGERRQVGYLQVARLLNEQASLLVQLRLILLLTGVAAICTSLFLGAVMTHRFLQPLDDITAVAQQITNSGDLSRRLPDPGRGDEIGRLTMVLNGTLERLENLIYSRQRFLADVSHELRTPLTTIRGNVDLMRRMGEADPEVLDVVQDELQRMSRLVDDLMLLARADSGGLPMQRRSVELDTIFLEVFRQINSVEPPVEIKIEEVDQVCVLGDPDRLKQLILNLVDNAIKYTPDGGQVMIGLSKTGGKARLTVSDTGIGIPEGDLPRIFDRFYRVDKARTRAQGGSGLGLSIAKWITQAHGGQIWVESVVGEGSTFTVILPVLASSQRASSQVVQTIQQAPRTAEVEG